MKSLLVISVFTFFTLTSCKKDVITSPATDMTSQINAFPSEPLNADEIKSLTLMREEEKLAHDVYVTLYNKWGVNVFNNIAASEQTHTDAILSLLNKYNLPDPVQTTVVGVFTDSTLQTLYNSLVAQGNNSSLDAFLVGATIEDLDIYDLNDWTTKVDNQDILYVFANLNKGSRNHMRSFYSQIVSAGGNYAAQFITQAELEVILNSPNESGSN
jgi:hypothetical protein